MQRVGSAQPSTATRHHLPPAAARKPGKMSEKSMFCAFPVNFRTIGIHFSSSLSCFQLLAKTFSFFQDIEGLQWQCRKRVSKSLNKVKFYMIQQLTNNNNNYFFEPAHTRVVVLRSAGVLAPENLSGILYPAPPSPITQDPVLPGAFHSFASLC